MVLIIKIESIGHRNQDGTGFSALSIPFSLGSYANLVEGSFMRGNSIEDVVFNRPSSILYRIYYASTIYLGNGLFYSDFVALPKASDTFVDLFSVPGTNYSNMEVKSVNGKVFSVAMDLDLDVGAVFNNCIFRRYRGSYNYSGYYNGFEQLPENITPEVFDSLPIVILPENQSYGLSVSPTYLSFGGLASDGLVNTLQFNVYGNDSYKIITSAPWISVFLQSSPVTESYGNRRFTVKVTENTGAGTRTGNITILGMHSNRVVISVSQDDNLFKSLFSPIFLTVAPGASALTKLSIESTTPWTVSCDNYLYGDGHLNVPNVEVVSGNVQFVANGDTASIVSSGDGTVQFRVSARSFEFDYQNGYVFAYSDASEQVVLNLNQEGISEVKSKFTAVLQRNLNVAGLLSVAETDYNISTQVLPVELGGLSFQVKNKLFSNTYFTIEVVGANVPGMIPAAYASYSSSGNGSGELAFTVPLNSDDEPVAGDLRVLVNGVVKGGPIRFIQSVIPFSDAFVGYQAVVTGSYSTAVLGSTVTLSVNGTFSLDKCLRKNAFLALCITLPDSSYLVDSNVWAEGSAIDVSESSQTIDGELISPFDIFIPNYPEEYSSVPEVLSNSQCKLYILTGELPVNGSPVPINSVFLGDVLFWSI